MERTFVMIKPDGVRRKIAGQIISRIEQRGLEIIAMNMLVPSRVLAQQHYEVHKGKEFFEPLVEFITSGRVIAMVVEGENAIKLVRNMIGAVNPEQAQPGTIRGDFTTSTRENLIHGSDSPQAAAYEIGLWFPELAS